MAVFVWIADFTCSSHSF